MIPIILADTPKMARDFAERRGFVLWRTALTMPRMLYTTEEKRVYALGSFRNRGTVTELRYRGYRPVIAVPAW